VSLKLSFLLLLSIAIAAFLIYVPYVITALGRFQAASQLEEPTAALYRPRALNDQMPAYAQRANWAHLNGFESFSLYAPAALMAYLTQVDSPWAWRAVIAYVIARTLFPVFYILNIPPLRAMMFAIGSLSIGTLYLLSCRAVWLS
jgi:uncharacterized MAPEG superfamily protein